MKKKLGAALISIATSMVAHAKPTEEAIIYFDKETYPTISKTVRFDALRANEKNTLSIEGISSSLIPETLSLSGSNFDIKEIYLQSESKTPPLERILKSFIGKDVQLALEAAITSPVENGPHYIQDVKILYVEDGYVFVEGKINAVSKTTSKDIFDPSPMKDRVFALKIEDFADKFAFVYLPDSIKDGAQERIVVTGSTFTADDPIITATYGVLDLDHNSRSVITLSQSSVKINQTTYINNRSNVDYVAKVVLNGRVASESANLRSKAVTLLKSGESEIELPNLDDLPFVINVSHIEGSKTVGVKQSHTMIDLPFPVYSATFEVLGETNYSATKQNSNLVIQGEHIINATHTNETDLGENLYVHNPNDFVARVTTQWPAHACAPSSSDDSASESQRLTTDKESLQLDPHLEGDTCVVDVSIDPLESINIKLNHKAEQK